MVARDPRFDATAGEFRADLFRRAYGFVDDLKRGEVQELEGKIGKTKNVEDRHKLERVAQKYVRLLCSDVLVWWSKSSALCCSFPHRFHA